MNPLVAAVVGYLIGSVSFARIVGRLVIPGIDLSETEYPIPGSEETWVYRGVSASTITERTNWRWGLAVVILDALKAFIPVFILLRVDPDGSAFAVMGAAVMVGHLWPVWWRFRGGRGQAVLLGALAAIDVLSIPAAILTGAVVGIVVFTSVFVARQMWPLPLIPWFWLVDGVGPEFWFAVVAGSAYLLASRGDIAEEYRVRRIKGIPDLAYWDRLRDTWHRFFTED